MNKYTYSLSPTQHTHMKTMNTFQHRTNSISGENRSNMTLDMGDPEDHQYMLQREARREQLRRQNGGEEVDQTAEIHA